MSASSRTPSRSTLRVADLQQRRPESKLLSVKVPAYIPESIAAIAAHLGASRIDVTVALLNTGLDRLKRRTRK